MAANEDRIIEIAKTIDPRAFGQNRVGDYLARQGRQREAIAKAKKMIADQQVTAEGK